MPFYSTYYSYSYDLNFLKTNKFYATSGFFEIDDTVLIIPYNGSITKESTYLLEK